MKGYRMILRDMEAGELLRVGKMGEKQFELLLGEDDYTEILEALCCAGHALAVASQDDPINAKVMRVVHHGDHETSLTLFVFAAKVLLGFLLDKEWISVIKDSER